MRKLLLLAAGAAVLTSAASVAKVPAPGPLKCATTGGDTKDPFYGVVAIENMMPPINKPRPIAVSGQYRLDSRSSRIALVKAVPQGTNPSILLLNLKRITDPTAGGHCLGFKQSFAAGKYMQVQIVDWGGHSITVDIQRPQ